MHIHEVVEKGCTFRNLGLRCSSVKQVISTSPTMLVPYSPCERLVGGTSTIVELTSHDFDSLPFQAHR
eukprot:6394402-Amphidinium_carterae.2